ncbi:uncharacterized protein LOC106654667 [Trichogramma pretiosum]|uniref:uncharacterized protein LOC106654667 n=1 Tax=Trichogramma pretiosum TaxID=7493 RepID=UPI0006C99F97|nr:uncharacterized protein LOC106654667 [Trichogramma pretiosum]
MSGRYSSTLQRECADLYSKLEKMVNDFPSCKQKHSEIYESKMWTKPVVIENLLRLAIRNRHFGIIDICAENSKVKLYPDPATGKLKIIDFAKFVKCPDDCIDIIYGMYEYDFENCTDPCGLYRLYDAAFKSRDNLNKLKNRNVNEILSDGKFNCTPLCVAVGNAQNEIVQLLLQTGANPNIGHEKGMLLPLRHAFDNRQIYIAELLLKNGANPNLVYSEDETTLLHWICDCLNDKTKRFLKPFDPMEWIHLLLRYKADINAKDGNGHSPMFRLFNRIRVFESELFELSKFFLKNNPNVSQVNEKGENVLHLIASWIYCSDEDRSSHLTIAKSLLDLGADVNAKDCKGNTPLQVAVTWAVSNLVKLFLDNGADAQNVKYEWKHLGRTKRSDNFYDFFYYVQNVLDIIELMKNKVEYMDNSCELAAKDLFTTICYYVLHYKFDFLFTIGSASELENVILSYCNNHGYTEAYVHYMLDLYLQIVQIGKLYIDTDKLNVISKKMKSLNSSKDSTWPIRAGIEDVAEKIEWARSLMIKDNVSLLDLCRRNIDDVYSVLKNSNYRKKTNSEHFLEELRYSHISGFIYGHMTRSLINAFLKRIT